ncbi:hypothetical protein JB92DRAFT_2738232 [Gautieria morchelliformis]|nr:hypothetical protein JB92DRAFT_2738232 [Gautieria morchelliformis]
MSALHSLESCRLSCESFSVPPPYSPRGYFCTVTEKHTEVSSEEEPPTLARMLFKYGLLPIWRAGIYILRSPLLPTPGWKAGKSDEEKSHQMQLLRRTELKWAHRCLWVMFGLIVTVFFLVLLIKFEVLKAI